MDRHRLGNPKNEDARGRGAAKNKENPISDTVYLLQNENDVLRMKYICMEVETKKYPWRSKNWKFSSRSAQITSLYMKLNLSHCGLASDPIHIRRISRSRMKKNLLLRSWRCWEHQKKAFWERLRRQEKQLFLSRKKLRAFKVIVRRWKWRFWAWELKIREQRSFWEILKKKINV